MTDRDYDDPAPKVKKKKRATLRKGHKWSKEQIARRVATAAANRVMKKTALATCDVKGAIIELRRLRLRIVADLKSDALAFPGEMELGILNALQCLQGENK